MLVASLLAAFVVAGLPIVGASATTASLGAPSAAAAPAALAALAAGPTANDITTENQRPGNPESEWQVSGSGDPSIQGYTTDISADRGGSVQFKVDVDATLPAFHIDIYRLGWYGGDGARKVATIDAADTTSTHQPGCYDGDGTGLVDCGNWAVSATWAVPADAVSGIYIGRLVRDDTGGASHVPFVVRNDESHSKVLFQTSDTTWQAYNTYGGNSLYKGNGTGVGTGGNADGRAYKVSYNRPITVRQDTPEDSLFNAEYPMLRWLERNGYDTSYTTDLDTDRFGAELLEHQVFMSVVHDEYWSGQQRANVEAARDAGVNLAFFSGNEIFWKTRWETSIDGTGTPYRTLVSYKETHNYPNNADPTSTWTGTWRDPRDPDSVNRPENALSGTIFTVNCCTDDMIVPDQAGATRLWRNSSVAASSGPDTLGSGILGYEWDQDLDNGSRPANEIRMSRSTHAVSATLAPGDYGSTYVAGTATHSLTLYKAPSGALVFGAGTVQWSWGLDGDHDRGSDPAIPAVQQATMNLLSDMGVSPATPQSGLVVSGASTDTTAPTVTVTSPTSGASVPAGTVTVQGTAADVGGAVGAVEVSTDAGATWHPAEGWTTWSYSFPSGPQGTSWTVQVRAVDDSFNVGSPVSVPFTIGPQLCPCSIFSSEVPPSVAGNDGVPGGIEVGVKFRADDTGLVSAIRLYKATPDTITLTGRLYSTTGTLLGSTAPTSVAGSGWQVLALATPVGISAGTTYVASYDAPSGDYAYTVGGLSSEVANPPLRALADGTAGPDGVYRYGGGFPTAGSGASNYWVDVQFTPGAIPDTTAPEIVDRSPRPSVTQVATATPVSITFSEPLDAATVGPATIALSDNQSIPVTASVSLSTDHRTAVLTPSSPLPNQADLRVTVVGGPGGVKDLAGNPLAADATWTFRTIGRPPAQGPGGPILVITTPTDPFSSYYAEILRAEGLNEFELKDIATLDAGQLGSYKAAILAKMPLSGAQVTMLANWVDAGGDLVAMAPDARLAALLGITPASGTVAEGYLHVDTASEAGSGITSQTMQFHGTADRYTLSGAASVATLFTDATTSTSNPAVTVRSVGSNGGHAGAFTFDLARSIVEIRQGNPAWAGQERDGEAGVRSSDLFYGQAATDPQTDWVNLDKVAIPQADEQQRLLANVLTTMTEDALPLPRLWYLPRGLKAAVVLTGDDHGGNGTAGRFDFLKAQSPVGCSLVDWTCLRGTSYLYPATSISDEEVAAYQAEGFEMALHPNTGCTFPWTESSLRSDITIQLAQLDVAKPSLDPPVTSRTHCVAWSDWASEPKVEHDLGMRLDTNYYAFPAQWLQDRPGMFTGSGFPMRFADLDGTMIDTYQATTQLSDEAGQTYPGTIDTLLDRAQGPEGYYGAFTANIHTDTATPAAATQIVASAQAHGVPVISAAQLLTWTDGRNGSSFQNLTFDGTTMHFTMSIGAGADDLEAMVPVVGGTGTLTGITRNGAPLGTTNRDVKGVTYAVFTAAPGSYAASYAPDTTAPVISGTVATPRSTSATITWTTNEPATSQVAYGIDPGSLTSSAATPGRSTSHTVTLTGLNPSTTYYYRIASSDRTGNTTAQPAMPAAPAQLTTTLPELVDTTSADFGAGTRSGTLVTATGDGAVALGSANVENFDGSSLPAGYAVGSPWSTGGGATVASGALVVDGAPVRSTATYGPGTSVEFVATFGGVPSEHLGFGTDLANQPWAFFSTRNTTNTLFARTKTATGTIDTPISPPEGSYIGAPHRFRVEWATDAIRYYVDGNLVQTHAVTIPTAMQVVMSDFDTDGTSLSVDQVTMLTHAPSGSFTSRVLDATLSTTWGTLTPTGTTPASTSVSYSTRTGNTSSPDGSWSGWAPVGVGGAIASPSGRYLQYQATLATADPTRTPEVESVTLTYQPAGTISAIAAMVPVADTHRIDVRIDGVSIGASLGSGEASAPRGYAVGTHTMTVAASGDIDLARYVLVFWGNCTSTGVIMVTPGSALSCAAILVNRSIPIPSLSVSDPTIVRPVSGPAQAVFTVSLNGPSFFPVSVHFATQDRTATTAAGDYTGQSGTLSFPAGGATSQTVSVPISATTRRGGPDQFDLVLSAATAASIADSVATATLINRQGAFSVSVRDVNVLRSTSAATTATFTVGLNVAPVAGEQVTVNVNTANGTATAGSDFTALAPTVVTFNAGEKSKTVTVAVAPKPLATPTRTFNLTLSGASANAAIADASAVATLRSTGVATPPPSIYITDNNILRPAAGSGPASYVVNLGSASTSAVTVHYATADGSATSSAGDYTPTSGNLTFAPGETSKTVPVTVFSTARHAINEDFTLVLSSPTGAVLGDTTGTTRMTNRSGPIAVSAVDAAVVRSASGGSTATVSVTLSAVPAAGETVTVAVATADGTAIAGTDYTALATTTVTFSAGERTKLVAIPVAAIPAGTPARSFSLALSAPSANAYIADSAALVNLIGP